MSLSPLRRTPVRASRCGRTATCLFVILGAGWSGGCRATNDNDPDRPRQAEIIWQSSVKAFGPPALDDNSAYFALRTHGVAAVNRATGLVRWVAPSDFNGSEATIERMPARANGAVVFGDEDLYGFDPATGERLWRFGNTTQPRDRPGLYPFQTDGARIYAGSYVGSAFAIDALTGTQIWRADLITGDNHQVRVRAVRNGLVYLAVSYNGPLFAGRVYALNAANGNIVWSYELPRASGGANRSDDLILADNTTGDLVVASFKDGQIAGLDAGTGALRWMIPRPATLTTTDDTRRLAAANGILVASGTSPDALFGFDLATGAQRWYVRSDRGSIGLAYGSIAADGDALYVATLSGELDTHELETGLRKSIRTVPVGIVASGPLISRDTLFFGGFDGAYAVRK